MPTSGEILAGLARIAHDAFALAVVWHIVVAAALVALVVGWRPSARRVAMSLSVPLASVAALAWMFGNPFNGIAFSVLAVVAGWLARRAPQRPIPDPRGWTAVLGALVLTFAWVYPHFLSDRSPTAYLYAAPMGLIPCPTLALVIGLALVTGVPGGRAWTLVIAAAGLFYALFGALRLGVWLDLGLLVGALGLLATSLDRGPRPARRATTRRGAPATPRNGGEWRALYEIGAVATVGVLALVPVQVAVFIAYPLPETVVDWFALFQSHRLVGLVDMDVLLLVDNALLGLMFLALYAALAPSKRALMTIAVTLELMAITTYFGSNTAFEMLALSDQYTAATSEAQRAPILAAGEAMIATWQGTAFVVSYLLGALAILMTSLVMLRGAVFGRATAVTGLVFGALSLVPASAGPLGLVFSLLSLVPMWIWMILIARRLFQLGRAEAAEVPGGSDSGASASAHRQLAPWRSA
jgi:hypothetical protein